MDIKYNDYIIDFDRVNKLTTHPNDNPASGNTFGTTFIYSTTRKIIKEYLEIYTSFNGIGKPSIRVTIDDYNRACEVLHFNKILVNKSDLRDKKIDNVLSDNEGDYSDPNLTW